MLVCCSRMTCKDETSAVVPCRHVTFTDQEWEDPPLRFEAGTAPMGEAVALAAACVYLSSIGMTDIADHSAEQAAYVYREVRAAVLG